MTDIVVTSLERWDTVWRRNQHLIAGLLAADPAVRVMFVEPPADALHDITSGRWPSRGQGVTAIADIAPGRLWRFRPAKWLPRRLDAKVDDRIARSIVRAARRIGMPDPLLWINDPATTALAVQTGWTTLYDMTDDWLSADRPAAELTRIAAAESYLLTHAAEVVACSSELVRRKSPARPTGRLPISLIPNAVDAVAYQRPTARPGDLPHGPCAIYVGTLHEDRIDLDLSEQTARALADEATLVFVGPNALGREASQRLRTAGALLLGGRSRDEVIGYLQHADLLVVPHVVSAFTDSLDPIKLYEYQAVGRRVVSTPVAGFRDALDSQFTIVAGEEFVAAVTAAVRDAPAEAPRGSTGVADWSDRVRSMAMVVRRALDAR